MKRILTEHGAYYIFHAPGGELTSDAASVLRTAARTGADFLYADEIERDASGKELRIVKPGRSPDTLLSYNYVGSPMALSETLLERVWTPASASEAERWAFAIRAFFSADFILRVPRALYVGPPGRNAAADLSVPEQALRRLGRKGTVVSAQAAGACTVRYAYPPDTLVSVLVAAQGDRQAVRRTLESVERSNLSLRIEYVIADGGAPDEAAEAYYAALEQAGVTVLRAWYQKNTARLFNCAAERAKGEAFLLLRAGDRVESPDALTFLTGYALQNHIGAAAALTKKPDAGERPVLHNVSVILRAPMLARQSFYEQGGMDESFAQNGCEAALCRSLRQRRRCLVESPDAVICPGPKSERMGEKNQMRCRDINL